MSENGGNFRSVDALRCLVLSTTLIFNEFTVTEKERNLKMFTFKNLKSKNLDFMTLLELLIIKTVR